MRPGSMEPRQDENRVDWTELSGKSKDSMETKPPPQNDLIFASCVKSHQRGVFKLASTFSTISAHGLVIACVMTSGFGAFCCGKRRSQKADVPTGKFCTS